MTVPATQIFSFVATIPAGTDPTAPATIDCSFPQASVVAIRWRVPPGPSGFMSFAVTSDGANVIPAQQGAYITADDESAQWDVAGYQDSGEWAVTGYNSDGYDHSVYLDFLTVPPGGDRAGQTMTISAVPTAPNADISPPAPDATGFTAGIQVPS